MSPNLYDLLDVAEDATTDEIRAAWKDAIADLDPTDRRFRAYSDAAGTLLDAEQRAAYDAELATARERDEAPTDDAADERARADDTSPDTADPEVTRDAEDTEDAEDTDSGEATEVAEVAEDAEDADSGEDVAAPTSAHGRFGQEPPQWALGAAGAVAVLALALAVWVATWPGTFSDLSPADRAQLQRDGTSSQVAAEDMAEVVFSYDHRDMDGALARAQELMTPAYGEDWQGVLDDLRPQVERQEAVVIAAAQGTGLAEISDDGDQAQVMVFVNQLVQKKGVSDTELTMWATLRMIREDGTWLLERICTTDPECG